MIQERITNTMAAGAVASPWWLPSLSDISNFAAFMLPILGCTWFVVQIVVKLRDRK